MGIAQKAFRVIDSCNTIDQLNAAIKYSELVIRSSFFPLQDEMRRVLNDEINIKFVELKND